MAESQREPVPRNDSGERDTLTAFLRFARDCLVKKTEGLSEEQLRRVLVPSGTNLLGLVQHSIVGERWWFGYHLLGRHADAEWDFTMAVPEDRRAEDVIGEYRAACADSDAAIAQADDLDVLTAREVDGQRKTLRWVLTHVTTETTRHAGHADLLRELIDGTTGR